MTLHDETKPVERIGRGAHYSVMRVPIWHDKCLKPLRQGAMLDFAIIWDEDHDERLLAVIEEIYFAGLLAPVRFIAERKGTLTVLIDVQTARTWKSAALRAYREAVNAISNHQNDPWPTHLSLPAGSASSSAIFEPSIIHEDRSKVAAYLQHIDMQWKLGIKPHEIQAPYAGEEEPEPAACNAAHETLRDAPEADSEIPF
jgi:hypothetical protein